MIHADAIQKKTARIPFPIATAKTAVMRFDGEVIAPERSSLARVGELSLSGSQVLAACVTALCAIGVLWWALIKLWLFQP